MSGTIVTDDRRAAPQTDRRKRSRSGRRGTDPNESRHRGLRFTWMFAAYLLYAGVRALAAAVRRVRRA